MKVLETQTATIDFDQEGDAYFMANGVANYLNEFIVTDDRNGYAKEFDGVTLGDTIRMGIKFDATTHITNTGGMGIKLNESNEEVEYTVFTI
tara:strand:- start:275 stop:550 length:276 start_codon:yes stop_codon:yes gene_type:complete